MRTAFVEASACGLPAVGEVVQVMPLLREAVVAAVSIPFGYAPGGRDEHVAQLILDELRAAPRLFDAAAGAASSAPGRVVRRPDRRAGAFDELVRGGARAVRQRTHAGAPVPTRGRHESAGMAPAHAPAAEPAAPAADASVLEVALEHGYDSPSALIAVFRRGFGPTPSRYLGRLGDAPSTTPRPLSGTGSGPSTAAR